jgi:hypothetical protein
VKGNTRAAADPNGITQVDSLEDAADLVKAIGAFPEDFEGQIYFGGGLQGQHTNTQSLYTVGNDIGKKGKGGVILRAKPEMMRGRSGWE